MTKVLVEQTSLQNIANSIREKNGTTIKYKPSEMPSAISNIQTGITPTGELEIVENGTYDVTNYASANVNIEATGVAYQPKRISFADTYFESDYDMSAEINGLDTSNVEWFDFSFNYVFGVPRLDLSSFNTSKCINFNNMFMGSPFEYLDLSNFTFESCFEACYMFSECSSLTTLVIGEGWLGMTSSMLEDMGFGTGGGGFGGVIIPLLQGTPIENGEGYVYVPDELVNQFKEHEVFMEYANQILPKSQLPTE